MAVVFAVFRICRFLQDNGVIPFTFICLWASPVPQIVVVSEKRDLMVLITPHIVTPEFLGEMQKKAAELEGKQDKSEPSALDLVR